MCLVRRFCVGLGLATAMLAHGPARSLAISGTSQIAWKGRPVEAKPQWPRGLTTFLNSPQRAAGWNPFFSEMPNDCDYYEFEARSSDEVNSIIQSFARIDSANLRICLSPEKGPRSIGYQQTRGAQRSLAVLFSMGDQDTIERWYNQLPAGKRPASARPPTAQPPTLTIFVQNPAVELARLKIPAQIKVITTFVPPNAIIDQPTREIMDRIEQLLDARRQHSP